MVDELENFYCLDCGVNTNFIDEYYMVNKDVWKKSKGKKGMLCIGCLEKRIGRRLLPEDFTDVPVNKLPDPRSARLDDRIRGRQVSIAKVSN